MNVIESRAEELFVGSYHHSLDPKRRLIIPSLWRSMLNGSSHLYAFPHPDKPCLFLYTVQQMHRFLEQLRSSGALDDGDQQAVRALTASADALSVDAQGRVRVKDELLAHASVKSKVVLVGTMTRIELWSEEQFDLALPSDSPLAENIFFGNY